MIKATKANSKSKPIAALMLLRQMSRNIKIRVIKKQTANERQTAIFAKHW